MEVKGGDGGGRERGYKARLGLAGGDILQVEAGDERILHELRAEMSLIQN